MKQKKKLSILFGGFVLALVLVAMPLFSALAIDTMPAPIDPQSWQLQRDMTWNDLKPNPVIDWMQELNPASLDNKFAYEGNSERNRKIVGGFIMFEYLERKFITRGEAGSDPLGFYLYNTDGSGYQDTKTNNPVFDVYQMIIDADENDDIKTRGDVTDAMFAQWWVDYLNTPQAANHGVTIDGFWRENSYGQWAVELKAYGPFTLPYFEFEFRDSYQNRDFVPPSFRLSGNTSFNFDNMAHQRAVDEGVPFNDLDFFFLLHAGNAESGVWQEFGQLQFASRKDVPYELGPGPRMKQVEEILTKNPEYLEIYAKRYEGFDGEKTFGDAWKEYSALKAEGKEAEFVFHLTEADWDWVEGYNDQTVKNTRYVEWTSWEAAVSEWSHAGSYTYQGRRIPRSTQGENSGMSVFAHEFGHISSIADNYGDPWSDRMSPATEPWDVMSRGSFGGPFGDHARWTVPGIEASSVPVHMMHRNKEFLNYYSDGDVLALTVADLKAGTPLVTEVVARNIPLANEYYPSLATEFGLKSPDYYKAVKLSFDSDNPDKATLQTTGYTWTRKAAAHMTVEVVDQSGYDSFNHDHGVILSRTHTNTGNPAHAVIDSHLYDIDMVDYYLGGEPDYYPVAHATQLADAAFHAGTSFTDTGYYKGGEYKGDTRISDEIVSGDTVNEFYDPFNMLHFYILDKHENPGKIIDGEQQYFLSYTVAMLHDDGQAVGGELQAEVANVEAESQGRVAVAYFDVTNTGEATDIIRVTAEGMGAVLLNNLYAIGAGETVAVPVYVELTNDVLGKDKEISFTASSESNGAKTAFATVAAEDLVIPNFSVYLNPDKTEVPYGYSLYVDVILTGDINYTRAEAEIVYDTDLLTYAGFSDLAGWVGEVAKAGNTVKVQSVPNMNLYTGAPCVTPQRLVRLKFTAVSEYALDSVDTDLVIKSVTVNPQLGVVGTTAVAGDDLTVTLYKEFVKGLSNNMELYPDWIVDGETQPIFTYGDAICEIVYVEVPCDTDRDGLRDRVSVWIMRPKAKDGFLFPVLLEHSSYHNGTVMWSAVSGSAFDDYPEMREPFRYKDNWPIHKDPNDPAYADTTHLTYEDIRYKGFETYNWPWVDEAFETGSWYTGTEYGNVPAASVSALDAFGNTIYASAPGFNYGNDMYATNPVFGGNASMTASYYRYYMPRGYALVLGQLLGNRDSDGITSTLHTEEVLSSMAVINWLNGEAKGYTSRRGNIEVKADWANGNVAMTGTSYPADIAFSTVVSGVKGLKAVMPQCNAASWYDYYRYAGTVNYPGGYGGEDLNLHASINFSRWRADLPAGGSNSNYFPDPNGQWFPKSVQDVFFETQNHMMEKTDPLTGDYNTEWEMRNFARNVDKINEDVGLMMNTAFMDWNSQPKLSLANWTVLLDKCPGTFREFISISSHTGQQGAVIYGKSIIEWWHSWMDHFLLGQDNGVVEALPDLTIINPLNGDVEGYWIRGNPNAQPGDEDYDPIFLERGGIVPGARNQTIYLVPGQDGKAGRLSYNAPATTVEHFSDINVLDMLQASYPGCPTLTDTQKTINRSSDGNYRVTTGSGVGSQAQFCEGRAIGVNRTFDFGITGTAPEDIQAINQQIFAAVDKPIEGRLMYLTEPLTKDVRMSGTGAVYLQAAPSKGVGNLTAAVVEIGRVRNMESSRSDAWTMTPGTGNNLLVPAYTLNVGGGTDFTIPVGTFRNPSEVGAFMNYKYVTVGYADVQNPDYTGKTWCEVPEQNYIPNFYFQTTKIVPGQYYPYTIELDPYDYIFHAGSRIGIMVFGTDPDYSLLYDEDCIPAFDIKIGAGSYAVLPLMLKGLPGELFIEAGSATAKPGDSVEITYSVKPNDYGFCSLDVDLPFNSAIYTPVSVVPAGALSGADFAFATAGNVLNVTATAQENIAGGGELFTVTYKVAETAVTGEVPLNIAVNGAKYRVFLDYMKDLPVTVDAGLLTIEQTGEPPLGITVNFPGITGAEVRYYTNVSNWVTVGVFDDTCSFAIPAEHKATWGTTTVQLLKGGMWYTFSGLVVGEEPLELNVPLAKITLTGITAACNLGLAQEDWVYRLAAVTVGEPIEYLVFDNGKKYIAHLNIPGAPTILIPDIAAGATVDLSGYF